MTEKVSNELIYQVLKKIQMCVGNLEEDSTEIKSCITNLESGFAGLRKDSMRIQRLSMRTMIDC